MIPGSYAWRGGREAWLRFGPDDGPVVVALLPLFEEANRTRRFVVTVLRELAATGLAGVLPDVPGTGESLVPAEAATLLRMREAVADLVSAFSCAGRPSHALGVRSGALLDGSASFHGRWHLAPLTGEAQLRELARIAQVTPAVLAAADRPVEVAGNPISAGFATELLDAVPFDAASAPLRTVRLDSDPHPTDHRIAGAPLWRRAEPGEDAAMAAAVATDVAAWVRRCEG